MKWVLVVFFIFLVSGIYAACSENQVDINSASLKELDNLYGIGEAKAQAIIDSRPYENIDDLINAKGIGEVTLEKIKEQELACVDSSDEIVENKKGTEKDIEETSGKNPPETTPENDTLLEQKKPLEVIRLNSKDIKTEIDEEIKEEPLKNNYSLYALFGFCVLLGGLFMLKRKKYKNEFD